MDNTETPIETPLSTEEAVPSAETSQPVEAEEPAVTFDIFPLCDELRQGIAEAGFREPTPIQQKAIPVALEGRDLLGQALTGTGKTAAFGLSAMERIRGKEGLQLLVLTPTRELAAQISSELYKLGHFTGLKTTAFTGGQSYSRQEEMLRRGVNMLVATPGRLIDLMENGRFRGVNPSIIVVDEADEMLDMGFIDDVKRIFEEFEGPHQTMLFSATMPKQVETLAADILHDPVRIDTDFPDNANNDIEQHYFVIEEHERTNAIIRLIDAEEVTKAMIFCRTREETDSLNILLGGRGYNVNCLHGDMEQQQRSRVMAAFRRGDFDILVATDVAARGLDVDDVSHVFNYHLPFDGRSYVHRIGRTGRAGRSGKAITLVTPRELRQLEAIRRAAGAEISLAVIPSREEVNGQRLEKLLGQLFAMELDLKLYKKICEQTATQDQDPAVLFTKMVQRLLAQTADAGPEHIGLNEEQVEELINRQRHRGRGGFRGREQGGYRRFGGHSRYDRPEGDFRGERPPRREYADRGTDVPREERPPRREYEERPYRERRDFEERAPRRDYEERAPRRDYGDRPYREHRDYEERPPRRDVEERAPHRDYGDRPYREHRDVEERAPRRDYGERPYREHRDAEERAPRRDYGERPYREHRDAEERPAVRRPVELPDMTKPQPLNPDGTPKLNRKQRRLLKFGPPREDGQQPGGAE